jgi:hypothetical protein
MLVLAEDPAMERLRREGGCRAVAEPSLVGHLPLVAEPRNPGNGRLAEELAEAFERASGRRDLPVVALCEVAVEGDLARFVERLETLGSWLIDRLQHDRTPFPLTACIVVAHGPIAHRDREALESLQARIADTTMNAEVEDGRTSGLAVVVPTAIPIYVAAHRTRLDHESRSWACGEVWPPSVARLLASIEREPRRTSGLRAWRSIAVTYAAASARELEREVVELVREAVDGGDDESSPVSASDPFDRLEPERPPHDRIDDGGNPRHRLDQGGTSTGAHPPVPEFWALEPTSGEEAPGGASRHADARLDLSPSSPWRRRFAERGGRFVRDRFTEVRSVLRVSSGPRSVLHRVWRTVHHRHRSLRWFADGGFFDLSDRRELERLSSQLRAWERIRDTDASRDRKISCAAAEAIELDRARSHFVGIGWRIACATSVGLFVSAIVGAATSMLEPRWTLYTGIGTGVFASLTGLVLLLTELWAGGRGRRRLERGVADAEAMVATAYKDRVELAADGELLNRSTAWIQNCARIRDVAGRLLRIQGMALAGASRMGRLRSPPPGSAVARWMTATMVEIAPDISFEDASRRLREERPDRVLELRSAFEDHWERSLRQFDPTEVGDIVDRRFRPVLEDHLDRMRDEVRADLVAWVDRWVGEEWADEAGDRLAHAFGSGTEFAGLSVPTRRASGVDLRRVIRTHSASASVGERLAAAIRAAALGSAEVCVGGGDLEPWGCVGLAVEEIDVSLPVDRRRPVDVFLEGPQPPEILGPSGSLPDVGPDS